MSIVIDVREDLHDEVERLLPFEGRRSPQRMVVHALIDLGRVTELVCGYEDCLLPVRTFSPHGRDARGQRDALTVDHFVNLSQGGSDRPDNLRLMHWACNVSKGSRDSRAPELRRRQSEGLSRRWQTDESYRDRMTNREVGQDERRRRSEAMKRH